MPNRVQVDGLRELRRDLKTIDKTLPARLNRELKQAAEPVRAEAARLAPRSNISRPGYKHIGDTLRVGTRGSKLAIYSSRTGAGIIHYGGRHPLFGDRSRWYQQKPTRFIDRAADQYADRVEHNVAATIETFMRSAGFH